MKKDETISGVREAATLSVRVARHLLRRTRAFTHEASRKLPPLPSFDGTAAEGHITLVLPELPEQPVLDGEQRDDRDGNDAQERHLKELHARLERAESAAAWLRARLRAERQRQVPMPQVDTAALAADLTRGLSRLHSPHPEAVRRVVYRTLAAHGLPISHADGAHGERSERPATASVSSPLPWPREQQETLATLVLAREPDVADPAYIERVLVLLAERGRLSLPELSRAANYTSAIARRRLRLAVEALTAIGALTTRDSAYTLNTDWTPPAAAMSGQGQGHHRRSHRPR